MEENIFEENTDPNLPMNSNEIITLINETLEPPKWSIEDKADGRKIDIFDEWKTLLPEIITEYRKVGWEVFWFVEKGKEYLCFTNPEKRNKIRFF